MITVKDYLPFRTWCVSEGLLDDEEDELPTDRVRDFQVEYMLTYMRELAWILYEDEEDILDVHIEEVLRQLR